MRTLRSVREFTLLPWGETPPPPTASAADTIAIQCKAKRYNAQQNNTMHSKEKQCNTKPPPPSASAADTIAMQADLTFSTWNNTFSLLQEKHVNGKAYQAFV